MTNPALEFWQQFPNGRQTLEIAAANGEPVSIAYGSAGSGPPLLLLHGLGSWSYNWRFNVLPLAQQFRVICVDAKGYGFSQTSALPEQVGHQVVELARVIEKLTDPPVAMAGESLGALTALAVAETYPDWVDRLVLINVPLFPQQLPSWGMRTLEMVPLPLVQWFDQQQLIRPFDPLMRWLTHQVRQEVVFDPGQITDSEVDGLTYPYLNCPGTITQFAADLQLAAEEIRRLQRGEPNWITTIQQNLSQLTCSTLILWSDCDRWFPIEDGKRLQQLLPQAQLQTIPNCGHVASSGNPERVNAEILRFLQANITPPQPL
jgi:pimeloyl-ACP methyl ester carboxylesterase